MSEAAAPLPVVREAVASFPDRAHFHRAVTNLLAAGFAQTDLSVLASHDSLAAAGEPSGTKPSLLPAGLSDEINYIGPLTLAGFIILSGGPIAIALATLGRRRARRCRDKGIIRRFYRSSAQRGFSGGIASRSGAAMGAVR